VRVAAFSAVLSVLRFPWIGATLCAAQPLWRDPCRGILRGKTIHFSSARAGGAVTWTAITSLIGASHSPGKSARLNRPRNVPTFLVLRSSPRTKQHTHRARAGRHRASAVQRNHPQRQHHHHVKAARRGREIQLRSALSPTS